MAPEPVDARPVEVDVTAVVAGGDGLGRLPEGRVVLARGALPGERVVVAVEHDAPKLLRGRVAEVVSASPDRVAPPCPHVAEGCGGCGWQHVDPAAQPGLKSAIAVDALRRLGRLDPPPEVHLAPTLPATGYRTTVRAVVDGDGRAGFRAWHGHDAVPVADTDPACLVAHPLVDEVLRAARFPGASEVTVRAGVATGERLVVIDPSGARVAYGVPGDVRVVDGARLRGRNPVRAWYHEEVAGRRHRISARSFFQARPDGAAALVDAVRRGVAAVGAAAPGARLVDLYGGVGLLGGALAADLGGPVTLVESSGSSVADARVNLADLDATVVQVDCRRWRPSAADVVVADPARAGLGREVVDRIATTAAPTVVLVSCDAGAMGRDAGLLAAAGHHLHRVEVVDLFPGTPHLEVVTSWGPSSPDRAADQDERA